MFHPCVGELSLGFCLPEYITRSENPSLYSRINGPNNFTLRYALLSQTLRVPGLERQVKQGVGSAVLNVNRARKSRKTAWSRIKCTSGKCFSLFGHFLLVSEILGDLSKEEREGRRDPKEEVINLSKKLFPYNSFVNMPYKQIIEDSFLGKFVDNDNRPFLFAQRSIFSGGLKGLTFVDTEEEKSIKRLTCPEKS